MENHEDCFHQTLTGKERMKIKQALQEPMNAYNIMSLHAHPEWRIPIAMPLWWSNMAAPMQTLPVLIGYFAIYPICLKNLPWLFFAECVTKGDLFSSYHRMANTA